MSDILEPLLGSMHWWRTEMKHSHLMLSNSTKARALHDYWWHHTETRLNEKPGAYFCVEHNQRLLILDDKAMIRIKLLDDNLESRNLPTIQAEELVHQVHQIPMLPPLTLFQLGYRLDPLGLYLADAFITCPSGIKGFFNHWVWQVWGERIDERPTYALQKRFWTRSLSEADIYAYTDYSQQIQA